MRSLRWVHYAVLLAVMAFVTLPNLGTPSLWDVDEGVNAECTREMMEIGTWVVPTFNGELRTAKPVMLYWIQRIAFLAFGISEWSARFPAFLLGLGSVLITYELARRMYGAIAGLLAGVALATAIEFCKLSHAATPDAPFIFFTTLTMFLFWIGHENGGRSWFFTASVASGLAMLTKGPAGLALPALIVMLYFAWNRELKRLWDFRLVRGLLLWALVAVPWYGLVIAETRGAYLAFFRDENASRFLNPMEGHRGPPVYYIGALFAFFAPWCVFLIGAIWYGVKDARNAVESNERRAGRFLLCWFAAYLVVFTIAATKLPNYIAPLYPAIAILTARFLVQWASQRIQPARWVMPLAIASVAMIGVVVAVGLLIVGGEIPLDLKGMRIVPGLAKWASIGAIPIVGSIAMSVFLLKNRRESATVTFAVTAVLFIGFLAAFPAVEVDRLKAPKGLVSDAGVKQPDREIRIASLDYTQPSVTFYAERKVERMLDATAARVFLAMPLPAYLFVTEPVWTAQLAGTVSTPHRIVARRYDFTRNCDVLVVTNDGARP